MAEIRYDPQREVTPAFLDRVAGWIAAGGEVLAVLRYLCGAGSKDYTLYTSRADFEAMVAWAPRGTDVIVFRDHQLPIRGVVTEAFIRRVTDAIPAGAEWMLVTLERHASLPVSRVSTINDDPADLVEQLTDLIGCDVAVGLCPDFNAADHDRMISAAKDGIDGPR